MQSIVPTKFKLFVSFYLWGIKTYYMSKNNEVFPESSILYFNMYSGSIMSCVMGVASGLMAAFAAYRSSQAGFWICCYPNF